MPLFFLGGKQGGELGCMGGPLWLGARVWRCPCISASDWEESKSWSLAESGELSFLGLSIEEVRSFGFSAEEESVSARLSWYSSEQDLCSFGGISRFRFSPIGPGVFVFSFVFSSAEPSQCGGSVSWGGDCPLKEEACCGWAGSESLPVGTGSVRWGVSARP